MKATTIILLLFLISYMECYSQFQIINIHDTIIKDDPTFVAPMIIIDSSTFIEGSEITCKVFVACHIYPETFIQGYFHAYIVPYTPKEYMKPTEVVIWGHRLTIINGKKYMKL